MEQLSEPNRLALYETLCDSLQDSVLMFDAEGRLFHANQRFTEAVGVPLEDLLGRHYDDLGTLLSEDGLATFREQIEAVLDGTANERRVELAAHSPVEGDLVIEARITGVSGETAVDGAAVVLRDVTERAEQTDALSTKSEQLAVVNRVLRHDIRNHMNIIMGWGEVLEDHVDGDGEPHLDRILRHGSHVVELTHSARKLVDAIEEEWEMDLEPVDLRVTLTRELDLVREQFPRAEVVVADDVPPVAVRANEFLGSVISNLLTNAIRHNDAQTPEVTVSVEESPKTVALSIADDGPGIPAAQREAIYEMGTKGPDSPGTGLGLYLVHSLVEAYGGSVAIEDNEPRGTVVTVELQRAS